MMRIGYLGFFILLTGPAAWAANFSMDPWIFIFEPQSGKISQFVTFKYSGGADPSFQGPTPKHARTAPVPVEITIAAREVSLDGKVIYPSSKGADNFIVYPAQFILYPGDSKKVQLQWVGSVLPDKEIAYGFIASQLPVNQAKEVEEPKVPTVSMNIMSRYEGILVVKPATVKPNIVVDTAYSRADTAGTKMVLILNNRGTGMQSLKNMMVTAAPFDGAGKLILDRKMDFEAGLANEATNKSIFAGYRRKVEFPWPRELGVGPTHVSVTFPAGAK